MYLFVPLGLWQKEMFLRWGHLRGSGELWFRSQLYPPACPWARSFYSFMPQLPPLAKWEQLHDAVLWACSICELLYPQVSKRQFLNNLVSCQNCRGREEGNMVRYHTWRMLAAVCSVYCRGRVNFRLWSPELTNLVHGSSMGRFFH